MADYTSRNLELDPTGIDPSVTIDDVGRVTILDVVGRNNYPGNSMLLSTRGQPTRGGPPAWGLGEVLTTPPRKNPC
jgi:hypothetical protein